MVDDHGSDETGAPAQAASIYELPFCDSELEANTDVCEATFWLKEVVPLLVVPWVLAVRKSDDEPLGENRG